MRMTDIFRAVAFAALAIALLSLVVPTAVTKADNNGNKKLDIYDNCDPNDPAWVPLGGCFLDPSEGDVTVAEFNALLTSPLSSATVGHPSWRFQPSYLRIRLGKRLTVENEGGRDHTFTEVANYGGGRVPPLNVGLTMAPECALAAGTQDPHLLHPGGELELTAMSPGLHKFQCCIHPWMRSAVRIVNNNNNKEDDD
jgi:plastocyanin